jgi:branched-subunit amino acid aminotransferase/4-amino-4-deoxychorismate lyase
MLAMPWGSYFSGSKPFRISTSIKPGNESLPMRSNGERLDGSMLKIGANYARTMLCHQAELGDNEQELIFLDCFGNVAEAGAANLFILRNDGRYLTPPLDSGAVLNGVTRDSAIQLLRHMGKAVIEENFSLETLLKAKAIFTTGTAAGITSVPGIILPGEAFSSYLWDPHDEVNTLAELYEATRMGKVSEFRGWLTAL